MPPFPFGDENAVIRSSFISRKTPADRVVTGVFLNSWLPLRYFFTERSIILNA